MFIWGFDAIFAVTLILSIGLVLTFWILYNLNRDQEVAGQKVSEHLKHCQYCGYVYLDFFLSKKSACRCPRCLSYHD